MIFFLIKRNIDYENCNDMGNFRELSDYREFLIRTLEVNSP